MILRAVNLHFRHDCAVIALSNDVGGGFRCGSVNQIAEIFVSKNVMNAKCRHVLFPYPSVVNFVPNAFFKSPLCEMWMRGEFASVKCAFYMRFCKFKHNMTACIFNAGLLEFVGNVGNYFALSFNARFNNSHVLNSLVSWIAIYSPVSRMSTCKMN